MSVVWQRSVVTFAPHPLLRHIAELRLGLWDGAVNSIVGVCMSMLLFGKRVSVAPAITASTVDASAWVAWRDNGAGIMVAVPKRFVGLLALRYRTSS